MNVANPPEVAGRSRGAFWEFWAQSLFEGLAECEFFLFAAVIVAAGFVMYGFWHVLWNAWQQNFAG